MILKWTISIMTLIWSKQNIECDGRVTVYSSSWQLIHHLWVAGWLAVEASALRAFVLSLWEAPMCGRTMDQLHFQCLCYQAGILNFLPEIWQSTSLWYHGFYKSHAIPRIETWSLPPSGRASLAKRAYQEQQKECRPLKAVETWNLQTEKDSVLNRSTQVSLILCNRCLFKKSVWILLLKRQERSTMTGWLFW